MRIRNANEDKTNWCFDEKLNGYIYISQLKGIDEFTPISVFREANFLREFKNNDVHVIVKSKKFDETKHQIKRNEKGDIDRIDGILTSQSPSFEYDYAKIQFKNKPAFLLPKSALTGLFELSSSPPSIFAYYDKRNDKLYLYGKISDASSVAEFV